MVSWITGAIIMSLHVASMNSPVVGDVTFVFTTEDVGHSITSLLPVNTKLATLSNYFS